MMTQAFLSSLIVSIIFLFFLLNTHQSCHKTSVIIKYITFNVGFTLDLCELNLNFFILTELLPQDYRISQDKTHVLFKSEGMS